ncbi:ribonuclease III [Mesorhizobium amorphae]|uniref:ribonuclease III n=1 Tax=Mesorhizobium amorphae TaxID=71433 RepID=UPI0002F1EAED|nr:ribonuclease III [Mesorhizobium amorphae]ANT50755.1 ribonuclease III [Mesorhizobium amorphae CCNWGS0123]GLR42529.1 ribonuclease 3 [Mesorhizobium amorphae]
MAATKRLTADALAEALMQRTGHAFADRQRLQRALTHASARSTHAGVDYERFEFLGDRVLGLVVADMLLAAFPDAAEGELSLRLNALVNAEALSEIAEEIGLPELIRAGSDVRGLDGRKRVNLRADALESLIAVLYLDGGLEAARAFIHKFWQPRSLAIGAARRDAKTELQEWAHQAAAGAMPAYRIDGREGPDHDPLFTVSVKVGQFAPAIGSGRSKREAEQAAAAALLMREGVWVASAQKSESIFGEHDA